MGNGIGTLSPGGMAWIVQSESPNCAHLYETQVPYLSRSVLIGQSLSHKHGGRWKYVPGHQCRGGWAVQADSPEALADILRATEIPVTVYLYGSDRFVPKALLNLDPALFAWNRETGYNDKRVVVRHGTEVVDQGA